MYNVEQLVLMLVMKHLVFLALYSPNECSCSKDKTILQEKVQYTETVQEGLTFQRFSRY